MRTLYQIHADMTSLKSRIKQLEPLWHKGDGVLLLGETLAYLDWLEAYLSESDIGGMANIEHLYALKSDFDALDPSTQRLLNMSSRRCQLLTDEQWVAITVSALLNPSTDSANPSDADGGGQTGFDRVITLA